MVEVNSQSKLKKFLIKQFLPIGFGFGVIIALIFPEPGSFLYELQAGGWKIMNTIHMSIIFLIFGLTLETSELKEAVRAWKALLSGLVGILVVTALTGFLPLHMGFQPVQFGYGLALFACVPTSLSSGVTLVIQSYGNGALALMLTVASNLIGIFVSPIFVKLVLGSVIPDAKIDAVTLLIRLLASILAPLLVGKAIRELYKPALGLIKKYKVPLYLANSGQIVFIVWETLSHSQEMLLAQQFYHIILAIMGAIGQHFFFLVINSFLAWCLRLNERERKAFIIMVSQKSLPTAAVILAYMDPVALGGPEMIGLIAIPCIVFYVMQLFIDAFIANSWSAKFERGEQLMAKYAAMLAELDSLEPDMPGLLGPAVIEDLRKVAYQQQQEMADDSDKAGLLANQEDKLAAAMQPALTAEPAMPAAPVGQGFDEYQLPSQQYSPYIYGAVNGDSDQQQQQQQ